MSENERRGGFMAGTALALSLSLAACATNPPVKTDPPKPQPDTVSQENVYPDRLPGLKPPFFDPIEKKDEGKSKSDKPAVEPEPLGPS